MQKLIQLALPEVAVNNNLIQFLMNNVFTTMDKKTQGFAKEVMEFLRDRCTFGDSYVINLDAIVNQHLEQMKDNQFFISAAFIVYANGAKSTAPWQFSVAVEQLHAKQKDDLDHLHAETNALSLPTFIDMDVAAHRERANSGNPDHLNLNLFTALRTLMLSLASKADKIEMGNGKPGHQTYAFIYDEAGYKKRIVFSYKQTS